MERHQLPGGGAAGERPHGHPEPGRHLYRAGVRPGAVRVRGHRRVRLQAEEDGRARAGRRSPPQAHHEGRLTTTTCMKQILIKS